MFLLKFLSKTAHFNVKLENFVIPFKIKKALKVLSETKLEL